MPIYNGGGGIAGITIEEDPTALKMDQNLEDLPNKADARYNLDVYSTGDTSVTINNALSAYSPPAPPVSIYNGSISGDLHPNRAYINNGTIVATGTTTIDLSSSSSYGWQLGDRFWVATNGANVYFTGANINNTSGHSITGYTTHICVYVDNQMGDYWTVS